MRSMLLAAVLAATCVAGCGGDEPAPRSDERRGASTATSESGGPGEVPDRGYTCGELRSRSYRDRQAEALLDEWRVAPARRPRQKRRLMRALFVACDPGPDYRRAAEAVARRVLGPKPSS